MKNDYYNLSDQQFHLFNELTESIAATKALTTIGMNVDLENYIPSIIQDYFGSLMQLSEELLEKYNRFRTSLT